jgi:hypothetical protein
MRDEDHHSHQKLFQKYFEHGLETGRSHPSVIKLETVRPEVCDKTGRDRWPLETMVFAAITVLAAAVFWKFDTKTPALAWLLTTAAASISIVRLNTARFPATN